MTIHPSRPAPVTFGTIAKQDVRAGRVLHKDDAPEDQFVVPRQTLTERHRFDHRHPEWRAQDADPSGLRQSYLVPCFNVRVVGPAPKAGLRLDVQATEFFFDFWKRGENRDKETDVSPAPVDMAKRLNPHLAPFFSRMN